MKLSRLITYTATIAGTTLTQRMLKQRTKWESQHNTVAICVDYHDVVDAAIRAGIEFKEMLTRLLNNGATHVSLPELTISQLLSTGKLIQQVPLLPRKMPPKIGHWNYVQGTPEIVAYLCAELEARLPYTQPELIEPTLLAFGGNMSAIGEIGMGFSRQSGMLILEAGLGVLPQVVAYNWPETALIERSVKQASEYGRLLGFAGKMVLGHEMHLHTTIEAMKADNLQMVWFAESRHQRGDWFVAKMGLPNVVLAHQWPHETMLSFDYHSANHAWLNLVQERGVRLCYVNFFRELHATAPLEGIDYVHHLKHVLEDAGYRVSAEHDLAPPQPIPTPDTTELSIVGLAAGGLGAAALNNYFELPESVAVPLAIAGSAAGAALAQAEPMLARRNSQKKAHSHSHEAHDHSHGHEHATFSAEIAHAHNDHLHSHDHDHAHSGGSYGASYAPKLIALAAAIGAPLAATASGQTPLAFRWLDSLIYPVGGATALAASTSGGDYQLRVEEFKGFNLEWALPLALTALKTKNQAAKTAALTAIGAAWLAASQRGVDALTTIDPNHDEGHTHHISAATRIIGDSMMKLGPRPARKWAGLGPIGAAIRSDSIASLLAPLGYAMGLVGYRRPERSLAITTKGTLTSYGVGALVALAILLVSGVNE